MKLSLISSLALVAAATAFAPTQKATVSKTALASTKDEIWDPLNLYTLGNGENFDTFPNMFPNEQFLDEAEIKHCRMSMLAWTGVWATSEGGLGLGLHFDGFPQAEWSQALGVFASEQPAWFGGILAFIVIAEGEGIGHAGDNFRGKSTKTAGDLNFDYLGLKQKLSPERQAKYAQSERINGRASMLAMASLFSMKAIPGSVPIMTLLGAE